MKISGFRLVGVLAALLGTMMLGCGEKDEHSSHDEDGDAMHEGMEHKDMKDMKDMESGSKTPETHADDKDELHIKGLSGDDLKLAMAQKVCPVSDRKLDSMGTPIKVEHEGHVLFICCPMCKPKFEKDPAKYVAKLKN